MVGFWGHFFAILKVPIVAVSVDSAPHQGGLIGSTESIESIGSIEFADVNSDGEKDIILIQASYNLGKQRREANQLIALIMKNGKISSEKVIFDGKNNKFGSNFGLFGHTIGCNNKIFVLNRSRSAYWRVH